MSEAIKISEEARECSEKERTDHSVSFGHHVQLLLNSRDTELKLTLDVLKKANLVLLEQRDQRDAELAELRKDKERLDWLEHMPDIRWRIMCNKSKESDTLRSALDDAMSGKEKP